MKSSILALVLIVPVSVFGAEHDLSPIAQLAGSCWSGTFSNGARDLHCYEWALRRSFILDHHEVRSSGSEDVYAGDTYFGWHEESQSVVYWYFNTLGGVSEGRVEPLEGSWLFVENYSGESEEQEIRTVMRFAGEDAYSISTEFKRQGEWQLEAQAVYARLGVQGVEVGGPWSEAYDLLFSSNHDENYEVYRRNLRDGTQRNLTAHEATDWVYSGGETPLMISNRAVGSEPGYRLFRLDAVGGAIQQLTDFPVADSWVTTLPDEQGFLICVVQGGDREILQINSTGGVVRQLTNNESEDCHPDITPDGKTVVFWSDRGGSAEIWTVPLEGGNPRPLTGFAGNDGVSGQRYGGEGPPRVSPDGERVAWMSIRNGDDWDVYTMKLDGTEVQRLTDSLSDDGYPAWSPDGAWLAFDSDRYGSFDLFIVSSEGGRVFRITEDPEFEQAPVWIPKSSASDSSLSEE